MQHVHFINKCKCDARADLNTRKTPEKRDFGRNTRLEKLKLYVFSLFFESCFFELPLVSEDVTRDVGCSVFFPSSL